MDDEANIGTTKNVTVDHNLNNGKHGDSTKEEKVDDSEIYDTAVYKTRWVMLAVVFLLNISNGALWITFATITTQTADYYQVSSSAVNWFSLVFFITTIPMMFVALWVTDKFGFKPSTLTGSALNTLGSAIRLISTIAPISQQTKYPLAITGQTIASLAQPFVMSLPTKVSEVWFPENQRTIATTIAAMANPLGFMVASIVSPVVVTSTGPVGASQVPTANYIISALGIFAGLCGLLVRRNTPIKPPSIAVAKSNLNHAIKSQSYFTDLKQIAKNKDFMILTLAIGGGMGLVSALQTMMAQIICPWGYDDDIAGLCCATMVLGGFVGAGVYSYVAEKTKRLEELVKLGFTFAVILAICLSLIARLRDISWALATVSGLLGFLAMGVYPVCLEAGVETTYPLDESFSSGMIVVSGQIQGAIFIPVMEAIAQPQIGLDKEYQVCTTKPNEVANDMTYSTIFLVAYASVLNILLVLFFKPKYRRLEIEKSNDTAAYQRTN